MEQFDECETCPDAVPAVLDEEWECPECGALWPPDNRPKEATDD